MKEHVFAGAGVDESETLVGESFDDAFSHFIFLVVFLCGFFLLAVHIENRRETHLRIYASSRTEALRPSFIHLSASLYALPLQKDESQMGEALAIRLEGRGF